MMDVSPALARLASGRTVRVERTPEEAVEVRAADGTLELRVVLGPDGPVVQVRAARLELVAEERLTLRAPTVAVEATEAVTIDAPRVDGRADAEIALTAPLIRLN